MKKQSSLALALIFSFLIPVAGLSQNRPPATTPPASPPPQQEDQQDKDDVVRISTNLVQVDAVITDKKGNLVTDLRPEEIEISEDGRTQTITNFSFVSTESPGAQPVEARPSAPVDKTAPAVPPVRLRPEQVRRTVALVVDDLGLSFQSTYYVRRALKKFVDQQMQEGDLVAIVRTAGGMGALQQFTSDKRQLYAAIERVKWNPQGRGGIGVFAAIEQDPLAQARGQSPGRNVDDDDAPGTNSAREDIDQFREELFSVGTLGALNYVVRGMRELPGRKSILLMSDGFQIFVRNDPSRSTRVLESLRRLTDLANRSSVVIYTMDARGLVTTGLTAADDVSGMTGDQIEQQLSDRRANLFESQNGLNYLARQTGGFPILNSNDLSGGIKRVLDDQRGYYLIGYRPDESTFDAITGRRKFHKISIKVKRPGLSVRSRTGFYGISEERAVQSRPTRAQQLIGALTSPFTTGGVRLRLTSLYGNDAKAGAFVRSLLHIDARDLTFTDEPDGWHKAVFDVIAVTFGDNGTVIDQVDRVQTIRVRGETYKNSLENGFVFFLTVPIKKPGAYQLRTALRDVASERVGSASQFIEVPNAGKNRLALSGIVVSGTDPKAKPKPSSDQDSTSQALAPGAASKTADEEIADTDPQAGPAVRRFKRGMVLSYGYEIYNAQVTKSAASPPLQTQMRLFLNGKEIFTGKVLPLDISNQPDMKRLYAGGGLQLGTNMQPGEYVLQVIVTDPLGKEKYKTATQWIDFEIVK